MEPLKSTDDLLVIERHGDFVVVRVSGLIEGLDHTLGNTLAGIVLNAIRHTDEPLLIVDLTGVELFGSMFLSVLLRSWKACLTRGGMMVLSHASDRVRELLKIVRLDVLWPIYDTTEAAMQALSAD